MLRFMTWRTLRAFSNGKMLNSLINQTKSPTQLIDIYNSKRHLFDDIHRNTILKKITNMLTEDPKNAPKELHGPKYVIAYYLKQNIAHLNNQTFLQFLLLNKKHNIVNIDNSILYDYARTRQGSLTDKYTIMLLSVAKMSKECVELLMSKVKIESLPQKELINLLECPGDYKTEYIIKNIALYKLDLHDFNHLLASIHKNTINFNVSIVYEHIASRKFKGFQIRDLANLIDNIADIGVAHDKVISYIFQLFMDMAHNKSITDITSYDCSQLLSGFVRLKYYNWYLLTILDDNLLDKMSSINEYNLEMYIKAHMIVYTNTVREAARNGQPTHRYDTYCYKFYNKILVWLDILQIKDDKIVRMIAGRQKLRRSTKKLISGL